MESLSNELSCIENDLTKIASLPNDKTILSKIETIRKTYHKLTNYLNLDMNFGRRFSEMMYNCVYLSERIFSLISTVILKSSTAFFFF